MRMWKLILILVVAAAGVGYLVYHQIATSAAKNPAQSQIARNNPQPQTVRDTLQSQAIMNTPPSQAVTPRLDKLEATIRGTGNIVLPHQRILTFGVGGDLVDIKVKEGDKVKQGQPLASLNPVPLQRAVAQARAKLAEVKTPYSAADIVKAEKALQDVQPPYNLSPYTPAEVAQARAAVAAAQAQVKDAEKALQDVQTPYNLSPYTPAEVAQARAAVAAAQGQVKDAEKALQDVQPPYNLSPYTPAEVAQARAAVAAAQGQVKEAENALSKAQPAQTDLDIAHLQAAVADAQKALNIAKQNVITVQSNRDRNVENALELLRQDQEKYKPIIKMNLTGDTFFLDPRIILGTDSISNNLETAYQSLLKNRDNARIAQQQGDKDVANAQATLSSAENDLKKAHENLARNMSDVSVAMAVQEYQLENAKATLVKAQEDLKKRQAGPNPLEVASRQLAVEYAKATLVKAQEDLKKRQAGPNPLEVSSRQLAVENAKATLVKAQEDLKKRQAGPDALEVSSRQLALENAKASLAWTQADPDSVKGGGSLADIQLREARIAAAQADYDGARDNLAKATLVAPFDGVVEAIYIDKNWSVVPTTQAMLLVDLNQVQAKILADEIDIGRIRLGQEVRLSLDAFPNAQLKGRVSAIAQTATKQSGALSYTVTLDVVPSADIQLREGLTILTSFVADK